MRFRDRADAGRAVAEAVAPLELHDPVVLGLPRGGVPVASEVATRLGAPMDVVVARKIGTPMNPELGMGAVAEGGAVVRDDDTMAHLRITGEQFDAIAANELRELQRRVQRYRAGRPLPDLRHHDVLLVDDGLATGVTAQAAVLGLRALGARRVVLAVPVCVTATADRLRGIADDVVCAYQPDRFYAVGQWYDRFDQTTDEEVLEILGRARRPGPPADAIDEPVTIDQGLGVVVRGDLTVPPRARGLVVFAHGSGSSRRSGRNRRVAVVLQRHGLATLLMDLLTEEEEEAERYSRHLRFDIDLLARRLEGAIAWAAHDPRVAHLPLGCFGASTGAAAALVAAARSSEHVVAVVSRGGRPDLAGQNLGAVRAPTLLIVGGADTDVLALNRQAAGHLDVEHRLEVVPGATHLFEEPGALEVVARLAADWFISHLRSRVGLPR